jgi:hypothetical protein
LSKPLIGASLIEILVTVFDNFAKLLFTQAVQARPLVQKVIQAFPSHTAQETLTIGIGFRSTAGDFQDLDASICRNAGKLDGEFADVAPG